MNFTQAQIETLRTEYSKINGIDPCKPAYSKLIALLDNSTQDQLKLLVTANIKFISKLARNRVVA